MFVSYFARDKYNNYIIRKIIVKKVYTKRDTVFKQK